MELTAKAKIVHEQQLAMWADAARRFSEVDYSHSRAESFTRLIGISEGIHCALLATYGEVTFAEMTYLASEHTRLSDEAHHRFFPKVDEKPEQSKVWDGSDGRKLRARSFPL
jgi:hypothetical protein